MLIKEVVRAKILSELITEQAESILNQHQMITEMEKEAEAARKTIAEKDALLVENQNEIIKLKSPTPPNPLFSKEGVPKAGEL